LSSRSSACVTICGHNKYSISQSRGFAPRTPLHGSLAGPLAPLRSRGSLALARSLVRIASAHCFLLPGLDFMRPAHLHSRVYAPAGRKRAPEGSRKEIPTRSVGAWATASAQRGGEPKGASPSGVNNGNPRPLVHAFRLHAGDVCRVPGHSERLPAAPHAAHVAHQRDLGYRGGRLDSHRRGTRV